MSSRAHSLTSLLAFWPLVIMTLIARLTFGGLVSPAALTDDPLKTLAKLSILCDDLASSSDTDTQHHHASNPEDESFLLSETLDLLFLSVAFCLFVGLVSSGVHQPWMFTSIRGPPTPKRTALCPQGPPA